MQCPPGSHGPEDGRCISTLTLSRSDQVVAPARDHHTTMVIETSGGPFLYVFGGTDSWDAIHADVLRAPIHEDGSIGSFSRIGELPQPRAAHTTLLVNGFLIIAGGITGATGPTSMLGTTILARLEADGSLGAWSEGPELPERVMHHTCDAHGDLVVCVGGRIQGNYTSELAVRARLGTDGTLSSYEPIPALPASRGFHQSFVLGDALYVVGGLHRDPPMDDFDRLADVLRASISQDGSVGAWSPAGELPHAYHVGSAQVFLDRVYLLGGMNGEDHLLDTVLAGTMTSAGILGDFETLDVRLSEPRMHVHQTPMYRTRIYSVGGRDHSERSLDFVDIGVFE